MAGWLWEFFRTSLRKFTTAMWTFFADTTVRIQRKSKDFGLLATMSLSFRFVVMEPGTQTILNKPTSLPTAKILHFHLRQVYHLSWQQIEKCVHCLDKSADTCFFLL